MENTHNAPTSLEAALSLTPAEIVEHLDAHVVGQADAKRMLAIALRNRWRRMQVEPDLREEIAPKNIIMMGATGVGKTELARRLAKLAGAPFHKVEATKFTEVGYVGRDVESMIRDLMETGVNMVQREEAERVREPALHAARERMLDLLLPGSRDQKSTEEQPAASTSNHTSDRDTAAPSSAQPGDGPFVAGPDGVATREASSGSSTRDKFRTMLVEGRLDDREVEMQVSEQSGPQMEFMAMPGMEDMGSQMRDQMGSMMQKLFPKRSKTRKLKVKDALEVLVAEETDKLIDHDAVIEAARNRVEQAGILFVDEIDKVCVSERKSGSADVSREGVQRDLLPIVEGSVVNTKYGQVRTDHILFIGAGAFHMSKPADMIPELQGRFPLRVELSDLGADEFYRILTEPKAALTVQYTALLATEQVTIEFAEDGLREIARFAEEINEATENIGARRLYTLLEHILSEVSFSAPARSGETVTITADFVREACADVREDRDLSRYIL